MLGLWTCVARKPSSMRHPLFRFCSLGKFTRTTRDPSSGVAERYGSAVCTPRARTDTSLWRCSVALFFNLTPKTPLHVCLCCGSKWLELNRETVELQLRSFDPTIPFLNASLHVSSSSSFLQDDTTHGRSSVCADGRRSGQCTLQLWDAATTIAPSPPQSPPPRTPPVISHICCRICSFQLDVLPA
jgi:hypothetical protein